MECYESRDHVLSTLGFESYEQYLRSSLWQAIRKRVMERNGERCIACGKRATAVHHTRYDHATLTGKDIEGLFPVCDTCHDLAEFDQEGNKRDLDGANSFLGLMQRRKPRKKNRYAKEPLFGKALIRKLNPSQIRKCKQKGCKQQIGLKNDFCRKHRKQLSQSDGTTTKDFGINGTCHPNHRNGKPEPSKTGSDQRLGATIAPTPSLCEMQRAPLVR